MLCAERNVSFFNSGKILLAQLEPNPVQPCSTGVATVQSEGKEIEIMQSKSKDNPSQDAPLAWLHQRWKIG